MVNSMVIFRFRAKIPFLGKFGPKKQNCLYKPKFGTQFHLIVLNLMMMLTFYILDQKYFIQVICFKKSKLFKVKFSAHTNSNLWNLLTTFIFSVLEKLVPNYQRSSYKFLSKMFDLIMSSKLFW